MILSYLSTLGFKKNIYIYIFMVTIQQGKLLWHLNQCLDWNKTKQKYIVMGWGNPFEFMCEEEKLNNKEELVKVQNYICCG